MACPVCGERCRCANARAYVDPDACDDSEQMFSASLESAAASRLDKLAPPSLPTSPTAPDLNSDPEWRDEVAARVERYRVRRGKPNPHKSMEFDWDSPWRPEPPVAASKAVAESEPQFIASATQTVTEPEPALEAPSAPAFVFEPEPLCEAEPLRPPEPKIIEFPRPPIYIAPPCADELADPIFARPRILDAPEEVPAAPLDMALSAGQEEPVVAPPELELPLRVAPLQQRAIAALLDACIVLFSFGIFIAVALQMSVELTLSKPLLAGAVAVPFLFWALYHYMFLVYSGTTLGMQMIRPRLLTITFDGEPVSRRTRRYRALAMILSCASLGLGLLWALFDEDTLCWHDRITRTYITQG